MQPHNSLGMRVTETQCGIPVARNSTHSSSVKAMPKQSDQLDKFKQAARELETDDDEKRFDERLGKIARQKPSDKAQSEKPD